MASCAICMHRLASAPHHVISRSLEHHVGFSISQTTPAVTHISSADRSRLSEHEILDALTRILRDLLLDDSIVLTMTTRRDEVRDWDSLAYISFMVGVETEFGVKFGVAE